MFSIVFGLIAICMGLWGLVSYWWYVVDVMLAILPIVLLFGGFIALMAGIKKTGIRTKMNVTGFKKRSDEEPMNDKL
jgi:vacuolar-type H+-ATPase subunit I/STV1